MADGGNRFFPPRHILIRGFFLSLFQADLGDSDLADILSEMKGSVNMGPPLSAIITPRVSSHEGNSSRLGAPKYMSGLIPGGGGGPPAFMLPPTTTPPSLSRGNSLDNGGGGGMAADQGMAQSGGTFPRILLYVYGPIDTIIKFENAIK